jgi:hypothetical protein
VLVVLTDDQDIELGSMEFMPKTLRLMRDRGVEFTSGRSHHLFFILIRAITRLNLAISNPTIVMQDS